MCPVTPQTYQERVASQAHFPGRSPTPPHLTLFNPESQGIREGVHPGSLLWEALDKTKALSYYTYHIDLLGQIYLTV